MASRTQFLGTRADIIIPTRVPQNAEYGDLTNNHLRDEHVEYDESFDSDVKTQKKAFNQLMR